VSVNENPESTCGVHFVVGVGEDAFLGVSIQESEKFISLAEFVDMMQGHIHPVILSSGHYDEHYSHHGVGTAFVLEYAGELFVVTAQHVLNNQGAVHEELRILLLKAPISILFDLCSVFRDESDPDLDSAFLLEYERKNYTRSDTGAKLTRPDEYKGMLLFAFDLRQKT
jgi:hypothetical protein